MTEKTKRRLYYVFTFGIGYAIAKKKAKKLAETANNEITVNENINFNLDDFIIKLGGIKNIQNLDSSLSCLFINISDKSLVALEELKNFSTKGVYFTGNKLNILFGDNSKYIHKLIQDKLTSNE